MVQNAIVCYLFVFFTIKDCCDHSKTIVCEFLDQKWRILKNKKKDPFWANYKWKGKAAQIYETLGYNTDVRHGLE